jgi:hypothetical protein
VRASSDGGATLPKVVYRAQGGDFITGIEIARSAPATIYLTIGSGIPSLPALVRSTDGGATWKMFALGDLLPANVTVRLFAIDPTDPTRVFLRVSGGENDRVAVATIDVADSLTVTTALTLMNGVITAFSRLPNGHLFVGGTVGVTPAAYLSVDNGLIFQTLSTPPTLKGASARGTTLYAVTDDMVDGFAIATSANEGRSWQPLMRYDQIEAIQSCVAAVCQGDCAARAGLGQWEEAFCAAVDTTAPPAHSDGGTDGAGESSDGASDGIGGAPEKDETCGCEVRGGRVSTWLLAVAAAWLARRRKPRGRVRAPA